jgi:hypothetical protein
MSFVRMVRRGLVLVAAGLTGCVAHPQLVMMNPHTGQVVGCAVPDTMSGSGGFLVSRACLSACAAHGFRPVPGMQTQSYDNETPQACLD